MLNTCKKTTRVFESSVYQRVLNIPGTIGCAEMLVQSTFFLVPNGTDTLDTPTFVGCQTVLSDDKFKQL